MPTLLDKLHGAAPAYNVPKVALGPDEYTLQMRWNWRSSGWRLTAISETTQEVVAANRRLSPGTMTAKIPGGELHTYGPDPYPVDALGDTLTVIFFSDEELPDIIRASQIGSDPAFVER